MSLKNVIVLSIIGIVTSKIPDNNNNLQHALTPTYSLFIHMEVVSMNTVLFIICDMHFYL